MDRYYSLTFRRLHVDKTARYTSEAKSVTTLTTTVYVFRIDKKIIVWPGQ